MLAAVIDAGLWLQLGALLAAAGGLVVLARRRARGRPGRTDSFALTSEHAIHVVELAGRRLAIGTGPGAAPSLLCELSPAMPPDAAPEQKPEPIAAPTRNSRPQSGPATAAEGATQPVGSPTASTPGSAAPEPPVFPLRVAATHGRTPAASPAASDAISRPSAGVG